MENLGQEITKYTELGIPTFPEIGKNPVVSWKPFQTRFPTPEEIKKWETLKNITGIAGSAGKFSDICVIDCDIKNPKKTCDPEIIKRLQEERHPEFKTGSGGSQFIVQYTSEVKTKDGVLIGVDIKSDGGCFTLPPSKSLYGQDQLEYAHFNGNEYKWIKEFKREELKPFPSWLLKMIKDNMPKEKSDWSEVMQGVSEGNRNGTAASVAGKILLGLKIEDWENIGWTSLEAWNNKCAPPLPRQELRTTFQSVGRTELARRKGLPQQEDKQNERRQEVRNAIISLNDFLTKELPPNKWVVDSVIPEGMTILSSAPGQFKTFLLLALSKQISNGEPAFNHFHTEKRNILFVNEEMGERMMQDRLKSIKGEAGTIYFTNLAGIKIDDVSYLLEFCKEKDVTLVMFDSLTRIHRLKENDADDVKKIFEAMLLLLKNNISVIMTHHHRKTSMFGNKNGSEEMRGSIDILAQIDCHLAIDQVAIDKTYIILKQLKIRISENLEDFKININKDSNNMFSFIYNGIFNKQDEVNTKVALNSELILILIQDNPGLTKAEIKEKVGGKVGQMAVDACLLDLEKKDIIYCKTLKPKTYYIKDQIETLF